MLWITLHHPGTTRCPFKAPGLAHGAFCIEAPKTQMHSGAIHIIGLLQWASRALTFTFRRC